MPQEPRRLTAVAAAIMLGLVVVPSTQAACGGNVLLGTTNTCNGTTSLTGVFASPLVSVTNTDASGTASAIVGNSIGGPGVRGVNTGTNAGVEGTSNNGAGVRGTSTKGTGVVGSHGATTGTNPGVQGTTGATSNNAAAVVGKVTPTSPGAFSAGVRGSNAGTGGLGIGVWGSQDGSGWGVFGESPFGIGVRGESTSGTGVDATGGGSAPALRATNNGGGPAAEFNASGAPFTVSSSTKVDNLNADQLDGRSADQLGGRTAVAAVISYSNDGTFAEQASIAIDAPADGLMLVSGSVSIDTFLGGDTSCDLCVGVMRLRDKVNGALSAQQVGTFGSGSDEAGTQLATTWVFPVSAGRRTFALDTLGQVADKVFADNPTLTALFVPFGPSGTSAPAAAPGQTLSRAAPRSRG
jgi:hypothetical protein